MKMTNAKRQGIRLCRQFSNLPNRGRLETCPHKFKTSWLLHRHILLAKVERPGRKPSLSAAGSVWTQRADQEEERQNEWCSCRERFAVSHTQSPAKEKYQSLPRPPKSTSRAPSLETVGLGPDVLKQQFPLRRLANAVPVPVPARLAWRLAKSRDEFHSA